MGSSSRVVESYELVVIGLDCNCQPIVVALLVTIIIIKDGGITQ